MVCLDSWVRFGATPVEVQVTTASAAATVGMVVVFLPRDPHVPLEESLTFTKAQLAAGVSWEVPPFTWCEFSLVCDRDVVLNTTIDLKGTEVFNSGCKAAPAGLAGRWQVTTTS